MNVPKEYGNKNTTRHENGSPLPPKSKHPVLTSIHKILLGPIFLLGFLSLFGARWVFKHFGDITLDIMVMQLRMPLQGTGSGYYLSFILEVLLPSLALTIAIILLGHIMRKKDKALGLGAISILPNRVVSMVLALIFASASFSETATTLKLPDYLMNINTSSDFIETNYVAPLSENIVFPEEKRNLIYIYVESMESTFLRTEQGGQMDQDIIPELFEIAQDAISFSDSDVLGGAVPLVGSGITSAGMVAQTSGLPLFLPDNWQGEEAREIFLSDTTTLGDILAENNYSQYLMVGSDARFGARDQYYIAHGGATIFDLFTARQSGIVPEDYDNLFWGMEDEYLYAYAKQELLQIAQEENPFSFTFLTVDTHFPDGYVCRLCEDKFDDQYSNVLACTSHQIEEFLQWLKQQDFYENTTVIIAGDHLSMNTDYFNRNNLDVNQRRIYNAFINTAGTTPAQTNNRMFASIDMFPTTLSALGVEIKGDRLGLGTNLFSDKPTYLELYGYDVMNTELSKKSDFYIETF